MKSITRLLPAFVKLFEPNLWQMRSYMMEYQQGLTPHLMASKNTLKSVALLHPGEKLGATVRDGWLDLTVPRVLIHEAVRVDLA